MATSKVVQEAGARVSSWPPTLHILSSLAREDFLRRMIDLLRGFQKKVHVVAISSGGISSFPSGMALTFGSSLDCHPQQTWKSPLMQLSVVSDAVSVNSLQRAIFDP